MSTSTASATAAAHVVDCCSSQMLRCTARDESGGALRAVPLLGLLPACSLSVCSHVGLGESACLRRRVVCDRRGWLVVVLYMLARCRRCTVDGVGAQHSTHKRTHGTVHDSNNNNKNTYTFPPSPLGRLPFLSFPFLSFHLLYSTAQHSTPLHSKAPQSVPSHFHATPLTPLYAMT